MNLPAPPPPPPPGYTPAGFGYGYPVVAKTDGMAIAAMVCGIVGLALCFIPSVVGLVLGFVSRNRIKKSEGTLQGNGMALTGIILGLVASAFILAYIVILVVVTAVGTETAPVLTSLGVPL